MDVAITRMSSKGQVVIPAEMRRGIQEGEKLVLIKSDTQLIMKKASELERRLIDDLNFAKRTEKAWNSYEKGEFASLPADKFLEKLSKC